MRLIQLTNGGATIVDDEDFELLGSFRWHKADNKCTFYAIRYEVVDGTRRLIYMHRQILGLTDRRVLADHKDHDGLNNRRENLRISNYTNNNRNRRSRPGSTSRFVGVCWLKNDRIWRATIQLNGCPVSLGRYASEEAAAMARDAAVRIHYGEGAYINLP